MLEPVNTDRAVGGVKTVSGVSLAAAFADALACESGEEIGLIPCADGGTGIRQWLPGEVLFDHAVMQTRLAMRSSALCGILWHQGEADCYNMTDDEYAAHFLTVMRGFREAHENPSLPIVIGELAWEFGENYPSLTAAAPGFNKLLSRLSKELPRCAIASAEGLTLKPDGLHFDAASLRVFGQRYLEKYYELI